MRQPAGTCRRRQQESLNRKEDARLSVVTYPCPCCGAPLQYSGLTHKLQCASCGNAYDVEAVQTLENGAAQQQIEFEAPQQQFTAEEAAHIAAYTCQSCGAELMTEETTTATVCPYCGSAAVLTGQIAGGVKPELVVPFRVSREEAVQAFENYFHGKRLLPNIFLNTVNRIAEMRRLYVPYWLFDCRAEADMVFNAERVHVRRQGDWEVIRTDHYAARRAGTLDFESIPVDGSEKLDNRITESLEPYDLSAAVPFSPQVLAGAMADRADVDAEACTGRAAERVEASTESALRATVTGYSSVSVRSRSIRTRRGKVTPALMPVWLITTEKEETEGKRIYTFAINGQTGRLTCDVPYDKKKAALWFAGIFAAAFAACWGLVLLLAGSGVLG